jgi:uncharacterized protein
MSDLAAPPVESPQTPEARPIREQRAAQVATPSHFNIRVPLRGDRELAFNSMTGSFALWEEEDIETFRGIEAGEKRMGDEDVRPFARMGYAVRQGTDEVSELELRYNAYRNNPGGLILTVAPTLACNFACDYCFQGLDKPNEMMKEEVQDAILEFVEEESRYFRTLNMTWYGGEPLLAMKVIRSLSKKIFDIIDPKQRGYTGFIVTNGFRLTRKVAQELLDLRVTKAQVTFDGAEHDHDERRPLVSGRGTFNTLVDNIQDVVENTDLVVLVRVNIDGRNKDRIVQLMEMLEERGLSGRNNFGMYFAPVEGTTDACSSCSDESMTKTEYGRLEAELTRIALSKQLCGVPKAPTWMGVCVAARPRGVVVVPSGDVHKCWDTVMLPEKRIGSIYEPEKLQDDELHKRWLQWTPFGNDVCRDCKILPNCAGMCPYKFVHSDSTHGEAGALPCPSWKFNAAERLFLRAERLGMVTRDDWDPERSPTTPELVGRNHDMESVVEAGAELGEFKPKLHPDAIQI